MNGDSAMEIPEMLDEMKQKALHDENLRQGVVGNTEKPKTIDCFLQKMSGEGISDL